MHYGDHTESLEFLNVSNDSLEKRILSARFTQPTLNSGSFSPTDRGGDASDILGRHLRPLRPDREAVKYRHRRMPLAL